MAFKTRARTASETNLVLLITCETVAVETPASLAMSLMLLIEYKISGFQFYFKNLDWVNLFKTRVTDFCAGELQEILQPRA